MIRRPPRSTQSRSSAASDVYKRQVLDFGLWARIERDELRSAARSLGVGVELHYLGASTDELWRRIEARNSEPPWNSEPISRAHLDEWAASFQAPDAAELALFDTPEETADC